MENESIPESKDETEEIQSVISRAQELATNLSSNAAIDQNVRGWVKEAIDKLALAHSKVLENEKSKLLKQSKRLMQSSENKTPNAEATGFCMNNSIRMRPKIQRNYKLTSKASFEVWLDCLRTELTSWMLLYLIDSKISKPTGVSDIETTLRKNFVKDIIISHIDEEYHKKILGLTEPMEILQKLRNCRKGEVSSTPTAIRTKLYNLRMKKGERVHDFIERFDQIIREHDLSDDPQKLTDQEKRSTFYQAIIGVMPEIRRTDSAVITTTGKEMNIEALRKIMTRIQEDNDADAKKPESKEPTASRATAHTFKGNKSKCFRCNKTGHWQQECPLINSNRWFCYWCNVETGHKGDDCPSKPNRHSQSQNKRFVSRDDESYGPPVKMSKFNNQPTNSNRGRANSRGNRSRGRGYSRGRGNNRGSRGRSTVRRAEYNHEEEQATAGEYEEEYEDDQGKNEHVNNNERQIEFIADSGATEHIVTKSFILSNFKIFKKGVIKSANKNDFADIVIDGRGDLLLKNNISDEKSIKLTNVIAAKDISENLLSLRRLVDAGFCIYLDDKIFRVYNKDNDKTIFEGVYEKPNWVVKFEVKKGSNKNNVYRNESDNYRCIACLAIDDKFSKQSQTNFKVKRIAVSEGEDIRHNEEISKEVGSVIGREKSGKLMEINAQSESSEEKVEECDAGLTSHRTIKIDDMNDVGNLKEIFIENPLDSTNSGAKQSEAMLWHVRLGHASLNYLKILQKKEKSLQHVKFEDTIKNCEVCMLSKMEKLPFKQHRTRADRPLQIVHSDLMGPIKPTSWPGGKKYIATFIDDYSRYAKIYCLKSKDETGRAFEDFLTSARNLLGSNDKVCYVRSDRGTEYTGGRFAEIMKKENIEPDWGPPYTPELNGVAERFNKTIQRTIRALMCDSGLPASMWELAAEEAVHTYNITPHKSINYEVPVRKFSPKARCHLEQIRRFGCIAYIKLPKTETKFSNVSIKAVLVGHTGTGYTLWHPSSRKFLESRHVRFSEKLTYKDTYKKSKKEEEEIETSNNKSEANVLIEFSEENLTGGPENTVKVNKEAGSENSELSKDKKRKRGRPKKSSTSNKELGPEENKKSNHTDETPGPITRSKTKRIQDISFARYTKIFENKEMEKDELGHILLASIQKDPSSYEEAVNSEDRDLWLQAIKDELDSMKENKVWETVERPKEKPNGKRPNIIDSKWVFKKKVDSDGTITRKARLVIRGFKDKNMYGLKETYAPVSRLSLIRATIAIINKEDLEVCQMDVKTAFLNGELDEEVFMEIPDGTNTSERIRRTKVYKLKKSLYGLKVSPKKWNKKFSEEVRKLGLENDLHDPCLFTWRQKGKLAMVVLYVDDMLVASNDSEKLKEIKDHLSSVFQMKDLGEPRNFLGMTIQRNRKDKSIIMQQAAYTEKILEKFNMRECKPQNTPMVTRQVKNRNKRTRLDTERLETADEVKKVPYREAIGSLMYLANATRPDIAYAVNFLARKQLEPTEEDWNDVKRIFRYLRGSTSLGIKFTSTSDSLEALTDSSFRDCENSTSTGGYIIKLFGDVIAWRSRKQSCPTLSTCQAEYLAMSDACQEVISLDKSIRYIIGRTLFPINIWCDNRAARDCTEMDGSHKLKTFDQSVHEIQRDLSFREETGTRKPMAESHGDFIKQCVDEKKIKVFWIPTKENLADIMTKPLAEREFMYLRGLITKTKY